jgi:hypothetical protein
MKILGAALVVVIGIAAGGFYRMMSLVADPDPSTLAHHSVARVSIPESPELDESATNEDGLPRSRAELNLRKKIKLLERGQAFLEGIPAYTATLQKQEVVDGELLDEQTMQLKCRHQPFSVYLLWVTGDTGREVLYVEGQNEGRLIAHDGGWKARLPAFSLHPESRLAMLDARYPVTDAGMLNLARTMLEVHYQDLAGTGLASCEVDDQQSFDGRRCYVFTTQYKPGVGPHDYRKSITFIDYEWNVPVHSLHFKWLPAGRDIAESELDAATLVESYSFSDIKIPYPLTDSDFDRSNSEYHFR